MLIDTFLFNDELEMLEFRLRMLWPLVDKFVIVEADHTHSDKPKSFNFEENHGRFNWAKEKIVYFKSYLIPTYSPQAANHYDLTHPYWKTENGQRNSIIDACCEFPGDSIVLLSDVDEIPSRESITCTIENKGYKNNPVVLQQSMFYYNLKFLRKQMWRGTIITNLDTMRKETPQGLRDRRELYPNSIYGGGWHLSWFGDIPKKMEAFAHSELNKPQFKDPEHIAYCRETGEDLFDRDVPIAPMSKEQFPDYFKEICPEGWW